MRQSVSTRIQVSAALFVIALVILIPMLWMLTSSFKSDDEIFQTNPNWIPQNFTLANYDSLFSRFSFGQLTLNSTLISIGVVVISTASGALAAYGFSRYDFKGSSILLGFVLVARMITPAALVVPLYNLMDELRLTNTLWSILIGISVLNLPFVVWVLKPFFDEVPKDVEESAVLDGLSALQVFRLIAVPLAAPGIFTVILFSFVNAWVDLLFGITFSSSTASMPLTFGLAQMQTGYQIFWGSMMAGGIYITLPPFLLAFALQRYFIRGIRMGF